SADMDDLMMDGESFIESCMDVVSGITDPLASLVGNGLDFLISNIQPLQDALHKVTGDGPALEQAAENFTNIGEGLQGMRTNFEQEVGQSLQGWTGYAAQTAGTRLAEFSSGIGGVAGQAGQISQLLQASSKIMTTIEEFIKGLIADLVAFLIEIWVPALAAAGPTFGGSTAAAASATGVRAGITITRASSKVTKLTRLLEKFARLLRRLSELLSNLAKKAKGLKKANAGEQSIKDRAKEAAKESVKDNAKDMLPDYDTAGDVKDTLNEVDSYVEAGEMGNDASVSTTAERFDMCRASSTDGQWGQPRNTGETCPLEEEQPWDDVELPSSDSTTTRQQEQPSTDSTSQQGGSTNHGSDSSSTHHRSHRSRV